MDLATTFDKISQLISSNVVNLVSALAVFVIGWGLALLLSILVKKLMKDGKITEAISKWLFQGDKKKGVAVEKWVGRITYFFVLLIILYIGFQRLGIEFISEPLNYIVDLLLGFAPRIIMPATLLLSAWIIATSLKFLITKVSGKAKIDDRLKSHMGDGKSKTINVTETFSETVYWLVFLVFLPPILESLELDSLLTPVNDLINTVINYIPSLFGAFLIFIVGWFIAKIVQRILVNLLHSLKLDNLGQQAGIKAIVGEQRLSEVIGIIAYVLILIPVLISTLNALKLEAITEPASQMLNQILSSFPSVFGAAIVLFISFIVGKVLADLASNFLSGIGFNNVLMKVGFSNETIKGQKTPAELSGSLILIAIMLFATIEALSLLGFENLASLVQQFTTFGGDVLLGLVVFGIGLYLANLAAQAIKTSSIAQSSVLAVATRVAVIVLSSAMALRQMGIAGEIVNITFGIVLGGFAVAFGLAFGLGGRDVASKYIQQMNNYISKK